MERNIKSLAQTIILRQAQGDLEQIRILAQQKVIPEDLLERAKAEFDRIRLEPPQKPIIQPPKEIAIQAPLSEQVTSPAEQQGQEKLTFEVGGRVITVTKKESYTSSDFAGLIGKDASNAAAVIVSIKRKDPRIQGTREGRFITYTREEFLWLVEDYYTSPRRPRKPISTSAQTHQPEFPTTATSKKPEIGAEPNAHLAPMPQPFFPQEQKEEKTITPEKPEDVSPIQPEYKEPEKTQEDKIVFTQVDKDYITLDGKIIFLRGKQIRKLLKELAEAEEKGVAPEKLQEEDLANEVDPKHANDSLRTNISHARRVLDGIGFLIPNLSRWVTEEKRVYRLIREVKDSTQPQATNPQTVITPTQPSQEQTRAHALPLKPLTLEPLMPQIQPQSPVEEEPIFVAEPEAPKNVPTPEARRENFVVLPNGTRIENLNRVDSALLQLFVDKFLEGKSVSKEEFKHAYIAASGTSQFIDELMSANIIPRLKDILEETDYELENIAPRGMGIEGNYIFKKRISAEEPEPADFSPLPGIVMRPVQKTPRPEARRRITQKDQATLKAIVHILSTFTSGKPEDINRNIRVILGGGLPPRTTLPQLFGAHTTDEDLKRDFIGSFANALENLWNKDQSPEGLSEEENQIRLLCLEFKQQNHSISSLIHDISRPLRILPPSRYRIT